MGTKAKVLIFTEHPFAFWCFPREGLERLRAHFPDVHFVLVRTAEDAAQEIGDTDVYFGWDFDPVWITKAKKLRWIHSPAAGVRRMMKPPLVAHPVMITNARGVHATVIAEHVIACMIMLNRQIDRCFAFQKERYWGNQDLIDSPRGLKEIAGSTVLVIGYGSIGEAVGKKSQALDMDVWAVRRHPKKGGNYASRVGGVEAVDGWLSGADFVVLTAPHTNETHEWFGEARFRRMKRTSFFINVSRGHLVDEKSMVLALREGWIAGAAVDVFREEPLPPDSPLWNAPGLIITPHVAGVVTDRHWDRVLDGFEENLRRFLHGESLVGLVDKRLGY